MSFPSPIIPWVNAGGAGATSHDPFLAHLFQLEKVSEEGVMTGCPCSAGVHPWDDRGGKTHPSSWPENGAAGSTGSAFRPRARAGPGGTSCRLCLFAELLVI